MDGLIFEGGRGGLKPGGLKSGILRYIDNGNGNVDDNDNDKGNDNDNGNDSDYDIDNDNRNDNDTGNASDTVEFRKRRPF